MTNTPNNLDEPTDTIDNIINELIFNVDMASMDDKLARHTAALQAKAAINKTIMEAQVEELERLKVMLAGFTWGPYDPFNIINTRITELNKKYGRADNASNKS